MTYPRHNKMTHAKWNGARSIPRCGGGFSIIEILIIMVILALLLALGVRVGAGLRTRARVSQARGLLGRCQLIAGEYQISTGNVVNGNGIYNFVQTVKTNPRTNSMLNDLGRGVYFDTTNEIHDPWGNKLDYYSSLSANGAGPYLDHPSPFFVSAGPDGLFGQVVNGNPDKAAVDNLYSYEVR